MWIKIKATVRNDLGSCHPVGTSTHAAWENSLGRGRDEAEGHQLSFGHTELEAAVSDGESGMWFWSITVTSCWEHSAVKGALRFLVRRLLIAFESVGWRRAERNQLKNDWEMRRDNSR